MNFDRDAIPPSTDGSYIGRMKQKEARDKILQEKFLQELPKVKERLKASRCKVSIRQAQGTLQLRATLPIRPGDEDTKGTGKKQYDISLSIPASFDGLKTAEEEAYELGKLIARQQFEWNDKYLGKKNKNAESRTIGDLLPKFKERYFASRTRNIKSENTFNNYERYLKNYIGLDVKIDEGSLQKKIDSLPDWSIKICITAVNVMSDVMTLGIKVKLNRKIETKKIQREVPDDNLIICSYNLFNKYAQSKKNYNKGYCKDDNNWLAYQWCYGMLATFGLRPREIFVNPDIDWWLSPENVDLTWKVHKDCKTGERQALPLHQEWIEQFDLRNERYLIVLNSLIPENPNFQEITKLTKSISRWFRQVNIPFKPYDLRHAWAIRAHMLGIPIKAAADNLGHTVKIHTETYQRWFSLDMRKTSINQALSKKSQVDILKEENQKLRLEIEQLKLKITRMELEHNYKN